MIWPDDYLIPCGKGYLILDKDIETDMFSVARCRREEQV